MQYLETLPDVVRSEVSQSIQYLEQFGKGAALPDVRPIASVPNLYETRTQVTVGTRRYTVRILLIAHTDDVFVAVVAGDKDEWSRRRPDEDWYDAWLPIARKAYDLMKEHL